MSASKSLTGVGVLLLRVALGPEKKAMVRLGAKVFHCPVLVKKNLAYPGAKALDLFQFDWILFTSVSGTSAFSESIQRIPQPLKIGCVGPETARAARGIFKRRADFIPARFTTEALARELPAASGALVLLVRSGNADRRMEKILGRRGSQVRRIDAYRVDAGASKKGLNKILNSRGLTHVFFGSRSQVEALVQNVGVQDFKRFLKGRGLRVFSIGPETSKALKRFKISHVEAPVHTFCGMIQLLKKTWKK